MDNQTAAELYEEIRRVAMALPDDFYGECARRKAQAVSAESPIEILAQVAGDLLLISEVASR